jgi:hypothetical protein
MEDFEPNLTIDEHIALLTPEAVEDLFSSLATTVSTATIEELIDTNLTDKLALDHINYMDEDELYGHVSTIIDLAPTADTAKQLAISNPTQAAEVLNELLYWSNQGRI